MSKRVMLGEMVRMMQDQLAKNGDGPIMMLVPGQWQTFCYPGVQVVYNEENSFYTVAIEDYAEIGHYSLNSANGWRLEPVEPSRELG